MLILVLVFSLAVWGFNALLRRMRSEGVAEPPDLAWFAISLSYANLVAMAALAATGTTSPWATAVCLLLLIQSLLSMPVTAFFLSRRGHLSRYHLLAFRLAWIYLVLLVPLGTLWLR